MKNKTDKKNRRPPTILTNDPSITAWGWAVIKDNTIVVAGCIKTESKAKKLRIRVGDDFVRRINELFVELSGLISQHRVNMVLSELPHGSQNASAAKMIGAVTAIAQSLALSNDIPIEWYSEGDAKKALLGKASATKGETRQAIIQEYGIGETGIKYIDEAIADALAIYNVAKKQSQIIKMMQRL